MKHMPTRILGSILLSLVAVFPAQAEVTLQPLFSDNMVLQRDTAVPIWGDAAPGEKITVAFGAQNKTAEADPNGHWMVKLDPLKATAEPGELKVSGTNTLTFSNIVVGDVWLCGGQSNMAFPLKYATNGREAIAGASDPQLRAFTVADKTSAQPLRSVVAQNPASQAYPNVTDRWVVSAPDAVSNWSAIAYFFATELRKETNMPIGLIQSYYGGTRAESWTALTPLAADPYYKTWIEVPWDKLSAEFAVKDAAYMEQMKTYQQEVAKAKAAGQPAPPRLPPRGGDPAIARPSGLYNGMIVPLAPYAIKGAIWYQGEGNVSHAFKYRQNFPTLIQSWRDLWGQGDFPFLFVQLSNYMKEQPTPMESAWAELRESQAMTLAKSNTGMATTLDIGLAGDVHPPDKQTAGHRLALIAEAKVYGKKVAFAGPSFESFAVEGNKIRIRFRDAEGLTAKNVNNQGETLAEVAPQGFAIAGADKKWVWAKAKIEGSSIVVWSDEVSTPVAVRYAWADNPKINLYNGAGLSAVPFRTDDWPVSTQNSVNY